MYLVGIRRDGVDIWDCDSKQRLAILATAEQLLGCGCSSYDGRMLAAVGHDFFTVVIWEIGDFITVK
jgi:hypothetical protein